jgi:hypothetical protein
MAISRCNRVLPETGFLQLFLFMDQIISRLFHKSLTIFLPVRFQPMKFSFFPFFGILSLSPIVKQLASLLGRECGRSLNAVSCHIFSADDDQISRKDQPSLTFKFLFPDDGFWKFDSPKYPWKGDGLR